MGTQKKKGKSGAVKAFISRKKALLKLNLSLKEFRKLCILKGVYPVEPKSMKKLRKGKTYYSLDDIQHLTHEPIIWKFWEMKIFMRRLKRATARKDFDSLKVIKDNKPWYKLDHIVKERYPTFIDAIRDLDDALSMIFLYSKFPKNAIVTQDLIDVCRKLSIEFLHYIIESRSLRKVFVSIKGYYFQAEIQGQAVTWIVPHDFVIPNLAEVDMKVMKTFTEFYVYLMGFVIFKLYSSNNLLYPPKVVLSKINLEDTALFEAGDKDPVRDFVEALNRPLVKKESEVMETETQPDKFDEPSQSKEGDVDVDLEGEEVKGAVGLTYSETIKLQNLFEGMVFFLNREVPREKLTFVIRSFGGQVSWTSTTAVGATFDETDDKITHHVVDREVKDKRMDRVYIQPQWIFDCVNTRMLLPVQEYFPGVTLPPHLSPFIDESTLKEGTYITPDAVRLKGEKPKPMDISDDNNNRQDKKKVEGGPKKIEGDTFVKAGRVIRGADKRNQNILDREHKRLSELMIPKKKKRLYDKIIKLKKAKTKQAQKLTAKRREFEKKKSEEKQQA